MDWDINDATIPNNVNRYDSFQEWSDDHIRLIYPIDCEPARRHASGWAMRNTNNHNVHILKKSCLGVLMCSQRCKLNNSGQELRLRPAICDKARKKQLGKPCPNPKCSGGGILMLIPCKGNSGFPCTHFWRHTTNAIFFQAKGIHDHPKPEVKTNNVEVRKTIGKLTASSNSDRLKAKRVKKALNQERQPQHPPPQPQQPPTILHHQSIIQTTPNESQILNNNIDTKPFFSNQDNYHQLPYQSDPHHNPQQQQLCPICSQYYCICYHHHHPHLQSHHNNPEYNNSNTNNNNGYQQQDPINNNTSINYNNNQETFKPSDIFNFEVSNYYPYYESSTTTTPHHQYHHQQSQYYECWNNNNWN